MKAWLIKRLMGAYNTLTDSELVLRLHDGDKAAPEEIYRRYWALLYQHARKMLQDSTFAKDVVHDIFVHLICNADRMQINSSLSGYLYRAVQNRVFDCMDKDKNRKKYVDSLKAFYDKGEFITDETVRENEMKKRIENAVADLPPKMREVFLLSRKDNMSRQDIAKATGSSQSTINNQINKAIHILRTKLSGWFF